MGGLVVQVEVKMNRSTGSSETQINREEGWVARLFCGTFRERPLFFGSLFWWSPPKKEPFKTGLKHAVECLSFGIH